MRQLSPVKFRYIPEVPLKRRFSLFFAIGCERIRKV